MPEIEISNRWDTEPLMIRLALILANATHPPVFDAAISAIREFEQKQQTCIPDDEDEDLYVGRLFPARVANAIENKLKILFLADLEKISFDDLAALTNVGPKAIIQVAAVLRDNFTRRDDDSEVCSQWYWQLSDDEISSKSASIERTRWQAPRGAAVA